LTTLRARRLHPRFFAEITGADLTKPPAAELVEFVERAMADHAVCVVRHGPITDEEHLRFARAFGPLELPPHYAERKAETEQGRPPRMAPELFFAGNLDLAGNIVPRKPRERDIGAAAERFHCDSSFNSQPSKWSLLRGVACPPPEAGGDTLFVDSRAAYDDLPEPLKQRIDGLVGVHDFWTARELDGFEVNPDMRAAWPMPAVRHPLVRQMADGRRYIYLGVHCVDVDGMETAAARALLEELYLHATQDRYIHRHSWREGDIVIWDNRCAMHAATPLLSDDYPRDMRRATVNES